MRIHAKRRDKSTFEKFLIMNKELNTNYRKELGYESPAAYVLLISTEGVLCTSTGNNIKDWENNSDIL